MDPQLYSVETLRQRNLVRVTVSSLGGRGGKPKDSFRDDGDRRAHTVCLSSASGTAVGSERVSGKGSGPYVIGGDRFSVQPQSDYSIP